MIRMIMIWCPSQLGSPNLLQQLMAGFKMAARLCRGRQNALNIICSPGFTNFRHWPPLPSLAGWRCPRAHDCLLICRGRQIALDVVCGLVFMHPKQTIHLDLLCCPCPCSDDSCAGGGRSLRGGCLCAFQ